MCFFSNNVISVHVLYCSGDLHGGNVTRPYQSLNGGSVVQVGLDNAYSALEWVKSQQQHKRLASHFSDLVVMGCSAGSIGAQIWARFLLEQLEWDHAAVIPDSYVCIALFFLFSIFSFLVFFNISLSLLHNPNFSFGHSIHFCFYMVLLNC
jgi:hypothetical protein